MIFPEHISDLAVRITVCYDVLYVYGFHSGQVHHVQNEFQSILNIATISSDKDTSYSLRNEEYIYDFIQYMVFLRALW